MDQNTDLHKQRENLHLFYSRGRPKAGVSHGENGNELYEGIPGRGLISVSSAFRPWRDTLVREIGKEVINEVGVDLIYPDESMSSGGADRGG